MNVLAQVSEQIVKEPMGWPEAIVLAVGAIAAAAILIAFFKYIN